MQETLSVMQSLRDKLVQAGVVAADYRPGETAEQRSARHSKEGAARNRRLKHLVGEPHKLDAGDRVFFFMTRSQKLKRLLVTEADEKRLQAGDLAVVDLPDHPSFPWAVVDRAVAEKVLAVDSKALRFYIRSEREQYGVK